MSEAPSLTYLVSAVVAPPTSLILLGLLGLALRRRRPAIGSALTALSLVALLVLSLPWTAHELMSRLEAPALADSRAVGDARAIVILAGGVSRGAPEWGGDTVNLYTLQRLRYGAWLARQTRLPVLVTGAAPRDGRPGETAMMRDVLSHEFGVAVRWTDEQSRTTAGNAREAAALLRAAGIDRVVLVPSGDALRISYLALREMAAGSMYRVVDRR